MSHSFPHGYALLIGVGDCTDSRLSLPVSVKDVQALQQVLENPELCGYVKHNLRSLHNQSATKQAILDGLAWLKLQAETDSEATVIVYYSGHGWLDNSDQGYYLLPHDLNPYAWKESAIAAEVFNAALHQIPAKRLLVILDCCHAQGMASAKDAVLLPPHVTPTAPTKGFFDRLAQGEGRVILLSSKGEQSSWIRNDRTMSIYTYHLIEALCGKANRSGETVVTVADIVKYLDQAVPNSAREEYQAEQQPWVSSETTNFEVALIQGGKGLSAEGGSSVEEQWGVNLQAIDDRSVVAQNASGAAIVTGDDNVIQHGKYNINAKRIENFRVSDEQTERQQNNQKGFEPLPGEMQPIAATHYRCPKANCTISWSRRTVGQLIPNCAIHHVPLVPVSQSDYAP